MFRKLKNTVHRQSHIECGAAAVFAFYSNLAATAYKYLLYNLQPEAHTLTVPVIPEGVSDSDMRGLMRIKYGVIIAGGLGKLGGKTVRVGHKGNCTSNDLVATMSAMEMSLMELGHEMEAGAGVGAAEKVLTTLKTEA